jgi:hypothetical protein
MSMADGFVPGGNFWCRVVLLVRCSARLARTEFINLTVAPTVDRTH